MRVKRIIRIVVFGMFILVGGMVSAASADGVTYVVTSSGDEADSSAGDGFCQTASGPCTLRAAIQQANATAGADVIEFNIDSGAQIITPATPLPAITDAVTIDGTSQPGYAGTPLIELWGLAIPDGGFGGYGLTLQAGGSTIRGLRVTDFPSIGIFVEGGSGSTIAGNWVGVAPDGSRRANAHGVVAMSGGNTIGGTGPGDANVIAGNTGRGIDVYDADGTTILGNYVGIKPDGSTLGNQQGIHIWSSSDTVIGGPSVAERNVVAANSGGGIWVLSPASTGTVIQGNYIGVSVAGTQVRGNGGDGIWVQAPGALIGGTAPGTGNVIGGNTQSNINLDGPQVTGTVIQGNKIGTNAAGTALLIEGSASTRGIYIDDSSGNLIGGTAAGAGNVISGNQSGMWIWGTNDPAENNTVQGNFIGTDVTGTVDLGNSSNGVLLNSASNNVIGGTAAGAGNVLSGNGGAGVHVSATASTGNVIQGNHIGTDAAGTAALPNAYGVADQGTATLVGGTAVGAGNLISGNTSYAVHTRDGTVQGNYLGTTASGDAALPNGTGVETSTGTAGALIGGSTAAARNVISGNGTGIFMGGAIGTGATVRGNYIGINAAGTAALPNNTGISIYGGNNNTIGGTGAGDGNVISGNGTGVSLSNGASVNVTGNVFQGNKIGTNPAGTAAIPNTGHGFAASGYLADNHIGGLAAGAGNLISGNGASGVSFSNNFTSLPNYVRGNLIGTDVTGRLPLGNGSDGLDIGVSHVKVGGTEAGAPNVIAYNGGHGIQFHNGVMQVAIRRNSIHDNGGTSNVLLGIDNRTQTSPIVDVNDAGDADVGANGKQNYPVLTSATSSTAGTTVQGTLNSTANTTFDIDLYANPSCDPSGYGEGERLLSSVQVITDGSGNATLNAPLDAFTPNGWSVTATATDPNGNTSEFSQCRAVAGLPGASIDDVTLVEGNSGTTNAVFTITLTQAPSSPASVAVQTVDATATAPSDYTAIDPAQIVSFTTAETSKTVSVPVSGDTDGEADETFTVQLSAPTNVGILDGEGVGTITSDDPPILTIDDVEVTEGNSGSTTPAFTVSLSRAVGQPVTVDYATANGTALAGSDYTATTGTVELAPGETTRTIQVPVLGDVADEFDETFTVNLTSPSNATISDGTGVATIVDNDAPAALSISDASVTEGHSGSTLAQFTVSVSTPSGKAIQVRAVTADASATAGADYTAVDTVVAIPAGAAGATVSVPVLGDTADETNAETFTVNLSEPVNATVGDAQAVGTINDDDPLPVVSVDDVVIDEGDAGTANAAFTVSLSAASGRTVQVAYNTTAGTATAGSDFTTLSTANLAFAPGETEKTVNVPVHGDTSDESDETFFVNLGSPTNATFVGGDSQGLGTIVDDDSTNLSVGDANVNEPGTAVFSLSLSRPRDTATTVTLSTANGTAVAGADYTGATGATVVFAAGETSKTFQVTVLDDNHHEAAETFLLNATAPAGVATTDGQGLGTIADPGDVPALTLAPATVTESTANAAFTLSMHKASYQPVTVQYATAGVTATQGTDYTASSGTATIPAGQTSTQILVPVLNDALDEPNETFDVSLSAPSGATIAAGTATGTITDDDAEPTVSVADVVVAEGHSGAGPAAFVVSLSGASGRQVSMSYSTEAGTATAGSDYTTSTGTVVFAPGDTEETVSVPVIGDTTDEPDEDFDLVLTALTNAGPDKTRAAASITDDDAAPSLSIDDVTVTEGNSGTTTVTFTVVPSAASGKAISFQADTQDGTATAPDDFAAIVDDEYLLAAGDTSRTIDVSVAGDVLDEADETFTVVLSQVANATLADAMGTGTVTDDDAAPTVSVSDAQVAEGDAGTVPASFTVTLSDPSGQDVDVSYCTQDTTATAPGDYAAACDEESTVHFAPGDTQKTFDITVNGDTAIEPDETFEVSVEPQGATLTGGVGVGTILDDDAPQISIDDVAVAEPGTATFTVTLDQASHRTVTVDAAAEPGTASADDFSATPATLTFAPGDTSEQFSVIVPDDDLSEGDEAFTVALSTPVNAAVASGGAGVGTGTITDAADVPVLSVADVLVPETDGMSLVEVWATNPSVHDMSVGYTVTAGSAAAGTDYVLEAGTVTIPAGNDFGRILFDVLDDDLDESDETFVVELVSPVHATIAASAATATVTIDDDDAPPTVSVANATVVEKDTENAALAFAVTLARPSGKTVTVTYATEALTAQAPADFGPKAPTVLTFTPGQTAKVVKVVVKGDLLDEYNERLRLRLSAPTAATIADGVGVGTITDNDAAPTLRITDVTVTEGNSGSQAAAFAVRLSAPSGKTVTVDFATVAVTATSPADFGAKSGTLTFKPGARTKTVSVPVKGDTLVEADERFKVQLGAATNATFTDKVGVGTILDND